MHQDIDGHLLQLYYIYNFMRGYLHHERHGAAKVLAQPELARITTISNIFVLFYVLCFVSFSRSFVNRD